MSGEFFNKKPEKPAPLASLNVAHAAASKGTQVAEEDPILHVYDYTFEGPNLVKTRRLDRAPAPCKDSEGNVVRKSQWKPGMCV